MILRETRDKIPSEFILIGATQADAVLELKIVLAQSDPDRLEETLYDLSMPGSEIYGKYLSKDQVRFG